jgi:hypothetical protein
LPHAAYELLIKFPMPTDDMTDPTVREADQRAERAKASLLSRVELLKHRFSEAKHRIDPHVLVVEHPLPAVGIAFALGVLAALRRSPAAMPEGTERSLTGAVFTGLAALGLHLVRELAVAQFGQVAKQWWSERDTASPTEVGSSRMAEVEPFLEH